MTRPISSIYDGAGNEIIRTDGLPAEVALTAQRIQQGASGNFGAVNGASQSSSSSGSFTSGPAPSNQGTATNFASPNPSRPGYSYPDMQTQEL